MSLPAASSHGVRPHRGGRVSCWLALAIASGSSAKGSTASTTKPPLTISLEQSSSAVPLDGTMSFTGVIRFSEPHPLYKRASKSTDQMAASSICALNTSIPPERARQTFSFSRPLPGLGLDPGEYPATFSMQARRWRELCRDRRLGAASHLRHVEAAGQRGRGREGPCAPMTAPDGTFRARPRDRHARER